MGPRPPTRPITAGRGRSCAIIEGAVYCWGGVWAPPTAPLAPWEGEGPAYWERYGDFTNAVNVSTDYGKTCVVDGDGALRCEDSLGEPGLAFDPAVGTVGRDEDGCATVSAVAIARWRHRAHTWAVVVTHQRHVRRAGHTEPQLDTS